MKTASVATTKNELSRLLRLVKRGQAVIITERRRPVARLMPLGDEGVVSRDTLPALYASGLLAPPIGGRLDVASFRAAPRPPLESRHSLTQAILAEREDDR